MRAVVQRVKRAFVEVRGEPVAAIGPGLLVLLGVGEADSERDADYLGRKMAHLRIFSDERELMNRSVVEMGGAVLVVSQFTLYGDCVKGRRPSFTRAARPERAKRLYEQVVSALRGEGVPVATGIFQEMMDVHLVNDGPVTLLLDSEKTF